MGIEDNQHPVRLIALDMDGTLLGADGQVSPRAAAALVTAASAGMRLVIATGRRHGYAMRQLRSIGLDPAQTLVSSNGAVIRTLGAALIAQTFLDPAIARRICSHLGDLRNALVLTFDCVGSDGEDVRGALVIEELAELHQSIGRWMAANEPYIEHVVPIERALDHRQPIQMMLCGTIARMRAAEQRLLELPGIAAADGDIAPGLQAANVTLHRTEYPDRDLSLLDILPAGSSKGAALLRLAAGWDIAPAEIMAFGDNWNDLSMLRVAGHPVLMGNAPAELLARAAERNWQIAPANTEDGVAQVLEALLAPEPVAASSR